MIVDKNWILKSYNAFNDKYFNSELPKIIAKTSIAKSYLGKACVDWDFNTAETCKYSIIISRYYDQPENVMNSVLLHEMIHIKDYYVNGEQIYKDYFANKKRKGHGEFFLKEAERVERESGYKIEVKASSDTMKKVTESKEIVDKLNAPYHVLVSDRYKDDKMCAFRLPKNYSDQDIEKMMYTYNLSVCYVVEGAFKLFKGRRGNMNRGMLISENTYEQLKKEANNIKEFINKQ